MQHDEAERLAHQLIAEHVPDPTAWSFRWMRRKRTLGQCVTYDNGDVVILLSVYFVEHNEISRVQQTVLHEIAHGLVGNHHGHDDVWRAEASRIGVHNPSAKCREGSSAPGRYEAVCPGCRRILYRYRSSRIARNEVMSSCLRCGLERYGDRKFHQEFQLTWFDTLTLASLDARLETSPSEGEQIMTKTEKIGAPALAKEIGVDAKTLRRFLRENASFNNPGSGGRYSFTRSEANSAKRAFLKWSQQHSARQTDASAAQSKSKTSNTSKARVDALEESLKASGKHISQHS